MTNQPIDRSQLDIREPTTSFEDIAGVGDVEELRKNVLQFGQAFNTEFRQDNEQEGEVETGPGLLLYGPDGVGKRLFAEAIAYELQHCCLECGHLAHERAIDGGARLVETSAESPVSDVIGDSSKWLEELFDTTIEVSKDAGYTVLLLDNIQVIAPAPTAANETSTHLVNTALASLERKGLVENDVLVVATAETPFDINAAIRDQFSDTYFVAPPTAINELTDYWRFLTEDIKGAKSINYRRLAERSIEFTPLELLEIHETVANTMQSSDEDASPVSFTTDRYLAELEQTKPESLDRYRSKLEQHSDRLPKHPALEVFQEVLSDQIL